MLAIVNFYYNTVTVIDIFSNILLTTFFFLLPNEHHPTCCFEFLLSYLVTFYPSHIHSRRVQWTGLHIMSPVSTYLLHSLRLACLHLSSPFGLLSCSCLNLPFSFLAACPPASYMDSCRSCLIPHFSFLATSLSPSLWIPLYSLDSYPVPILSCSCLILYLSLLATSLPPPPVTSRLLSCF